MDLHDFALGKIDISAGDQHDDDSMSREVRACHARHRLDGVDDLDELGVRLRRAVRWSYSGVYRSPSRNGERDTAVTLGSCHTTPYLSNCGVRHGPDLGILGHEGIF